MTGLTGYIGHNIGTIPLGIVLLRFPLIRLYMEDPPTLLDYIPKTAKLQSIEEELISRDIALQLLKNNLVKAKDRMKKLADTHRTDREFNEGDWVFSKTPVL